MGHATEPGGRGGARTGIGSTAAFAELDRVPFTEMPLEEALTCVADVTCRSVPGASEVSVTVLGPAGAHSAAFTGKKALELDEWQYEHGHGPCLAAAAADITVLITDTAGDRRWARWSDRAVDAGVHSSLSVGLPLRNSISGALNVYGAAPDAFDDEAVVLAQTLAGYAAVAMANAPGIRNPRAPGTPWASLPDHLVLEQAKGIVMADRRCTAEEALGVLKYLAKESHRSVHEV
ncbi:GAF and ANTAR domain-containing protein, partial [Actinoplanes sp. NPDC051633]|uniref:GAF and ANTAR domain-containing protein n=1 Tax=Actinoplanes sp. NPDC051633 TaxID=3155670 RepID=UPI003430E591